MKNLNNYYDKDLNEYAIPVCDCGEETSSLIIKKMKEGYSMAYVMAGDYGCDEDSYLLFSLVNKNHRSTLNFREKIYDWLHQKGVHYFTHISLKEYARNEKYQDAMDYVLKNGFDMELMGCFLACKWKDDGFEFIDVEAG